MNLGWQDGTVDKGSFCQVSWPEFDLWNRYGRKRTNFFRLSSDLHMGYPPHTQINKWSTFIAVKETYTLFCNQLLGLTCPEASWKSTRDRNEYFQSDARWTLSDAFLASSMEEGQEEHISSLHGGTAVPSLSSRWFTALDQTQVTVVGPHQAKQWLMDII